MEQSLKSLLDANKIPQAAQIRILAGMQAYCEEAKLIMQKTVVFSYPLGKLSQDEIDAIVADMNIKIESAISDSVSELLAKLGAERFNRELDFCRTLGLLGHL